MQIAGGQIQSELARAESACRDMETKLSHIKVLLHEKKAEQQELDSQRHTLERTGDINRLMALKQRSIALDKSIHELKQSEAECLQRIDSAARYLRGLKDRLEKLRKEAASLAEKISADEVPPDLLPQIKVSLRRVQMQIESLAGAEAV
jgi:chromosome segregation ATPase